MIEVGHRGVEVPEIARRERHGATLPVVGWRPAVGAGLASGAVEIVNSFVVRAPIDVAWATLTDLPRIAPCLPGATLSGVEGDVYKGHVTVKVGPIVAKFGGQATFDPMDAVDTRLFSITDSGWTSSRAPGTRGLAGGGAEAWAPGPGIC